ncbi:MAG: glycosyltransferase family 2 protein [Nitrospinota bacterium]
MRAVVCLPTRNERESIEGMIEAVRALGLDLFISDENSTDGTLEIARRLGVPTHQRNGSGKGKGVQKALEVAEREGYEVMVLIDCDHSYPVDRIPELITYMSSYDMAVGSRRMGDIPFSHRLVNILHTQAINFLFGGRLRDINSGLRALRVEKFAGRVTAAGFDVEAQLTCLALRQGLRVKEVPVEYRKRRGKSKIRAWDTWVILRRILLERLRSEGP